MEIIKLYTCTIQGTLFETRKTSKIDDETLKFIRQKRPHMQSKGKRPDHEGKYVVFGVR